MSHTLAPSLAQLRTETNVRWPGRDTSYDGTIGDAAHAARVSEHNPDQAGVIRAIDITAKGAMAALLLSAAIGDARVHYVIHNELIYSRHNGWKAKRYTGASKHKHHVHISIRNNTSERATAAERARAAADTSPWFTGTPNTDNPNTDNPNTDAQEDDMGSPKDNANELLGRIITANGKKQSLQAHLAELFALNGAQSVAVGAEAKRDRDLVDQVAALDAKVAALDAKLDKLIGLLK